MSKQSIKSVDLLSKTRVTYGTLLTVEPKPGAKVRQLTAAIALATAVGANRLQAINWHSPVQSLGRLGVPILFPSLPFFP